MFFRGPWTVQENQRLFVYGLYFPDPGHQAFALFDQAFIKFTLYTFSSKQYETHVGTFHNVLAKVCKRFNL